MSTRTYKVGTFYQPPSPIKRSYVNAYTVWYSTTWDGCIEYSVEATSAAQAKLLAIELRLAHEVALLQKACPDV